MEEQVKAVQRMQKYISEHLHEKIGMNDLASVSLFSPWYSVKLFKEFTGYTTAQYIRRLKLTKSALKLLDGDCRIIDVAMDMGFESVDGYQRAFRREYGCNPSEYAKRLVPAILFMPDGILKKQEYESEEKKMNNFNNIFIQVIEKPARKVIIKRGIKAADYFAYCEEVGCDIWDRLVAMKSLCGEPVCLWLPEKYRKPNTSEYVQGVEVEADYDGEIPDGFDIISLPCCKYLMFQSEPFADEDFGEAIDLIWKAEAKYNPEAIGYTYDKENPRIQLVPLGARGYIEMIAIK